MALPVRRSTDLQGWNPFRELDDLHERMSRLLESTFGGDGSSTVTGWAPPVDIEETDDAFVVEAELPGVKREDITVDMRDNTHGRVRLLRRPPGTDHADDVEAHLQEGVLRVQVRKAELAEPRRIGVTAG